MTRVSNIMRKQNLRFFAEQELGDYAFGPQKPQVIVLLSISSGI